MDNTANLMEKPTAVPVDNTANPTMWTVTMGNAVGTEADWGFHN